MPDTDRPGVLLSWVDLRTDPYSTRNETSTPGPTLTLLFDPASPYRGRIGRAVLFYRQTDEQPRAHLDVAAAEATRKEVERLSQGQTTVDLVAWSGDDPTDHRGLFEFMKPQVAAVRDEHPEAELVIHISPGTPAMQTVWVLTAEMGMVGPPFEVVKSLPKAYRAGRPAVVPVRLDIPTFYKTFQEARPRTQAPGDVPLLYPQHFVSDALKRLYADARRFAQLNVPILILGERGTGKTTLASWIRIHSPFRKAELDRSWPSVPCSQYSPETMRAELFGYVKGAFTDAHKDTEGLLHLADGDTLFLDEIGDISRDLQRMLIRALEEKHFTRVGARTPERSNFRLLSATNQPWDDLTERLDLDFLDRIGVLVLEVPPLRAVRADLPWLWRHVFHQALRRSHIAPARIHLAEPDHAQVIDVLQHHPLPGNLRDLFRVAYHLVAATLDAPASTSIEDLVRQALAPKTQHGQAPGTEVGLARAVAAAFAQAEPLDALINGEALPTRTVERALRRYLADELRRIARGRGHRPQDLCDVTDRTLQEWVKWEGTE
ncbi:MAG: sigma 54-interacting transcriptional regulator [Bacteroidota bacterium]